MTGRFEVDVKRSRLMWVAQVREHPSAFTQARTLEQLDVFVREVLALVADEPEDAYRDAELVWHFADPTLKAALAARARASAAEERASELTARAVATLAAKQISQRDAARLLGVSAQRVQQISALTIGPKKRGRPVEQSGRATA